MRRIFGEKIDCEKFITHFEGFIAQSGDLSLISRIYRSI